MADYLLPDVGEGLTEAELVSWKVAVGDVIAVNDIVCEIETAKSIVELPSPYAGTVTGLLVEVGTTVPVGTPIISVAQAGEAVGASAATGASDAAKAGETAPEPIDTNIPPEGNVTLVGYGPRAAQSQRRPRRDASAAAPTPVSPTPVSPTPVSPAPVSPAPVSPAPPSPAPPSPAPPSPAELRVLAKPPVRKLAKELGVDLATVTPTGIAPAGAEFSGAEFSGAEFSGAESSRAVITRADVEAAARAHSAAWTDAVFGDVQAVPGAQATEAAYPGTAAGLAFTTDGLTDRREPIKGVRKMMAQAMVDSAFTAPHVTEWVTIDATRTVEFVQRLKQRREFREVKVSPLLVVARACLLALRRTPEINSTWDEAAGEVVFKGSCNLGIAAATPRGLVVPNVKAADRLGLVELAAAINELGRTAREGRTQPAEMAGGSFTITNVGVFGIDGGTPIINPGESAILAMGAIRKQPWVVTTRDADGTEHDEIAVRQVTTLGLSFDHRHIDGAIGSRFLADVAAIVEDPGNALLF